MFRSLVYLALLAPFVKAVTTQLTTTAPNPEAGRWGYGSLGCFPDSVASRVLRGASFADPDRFFLPACATFCNTRGFQYFGIEFGRECFCDWKIHNNPPQAPQSECNSICTGRNDTYCGGPDRIHIFSRDPAFPTPTAPFTVNDYYLIGCFTDSAQARTLERRIDLPGDMTIPKCTAACRSAGYTHAGVEYGTECFCGSAIRNPGELELMEQCDMTCAGDSTQLCGAADRLIVYLGPVS